MLKKLPLLLLLFPIISQSQNLPHHMEISPDGRMLTTGATNNNDYYDQSIVRPIYLTFASPSFWTQLTANYATKTYLPATMVVASSSGLAGALDRCIAANTSDCSHIAAVLPSPSSSAPNSTPR